MDGPDEPVEAAARRVLVLVCGERLRRDDGAAPAAVAALPDRARVVAEIREVGQLDIEPLLEAGPDVAVVVADAAVGVAAGATAVVPLDDVASGAGRVGPASSHAMPPAQVLAIARELRGSLPRGTFVGIGAADFGFGEGFSAEVAAGLPAYVAALAAEIERLAGERR